MTPAKGRQIVNDVRARSKFRFADDGTVLGLHNTGDTIKHAGLAGGCEKADPGDR